MSSSIIDALSEQNQARVATILESCLFALEHGERLSPEELLEAHPDLAEPLGKCLTTLMTLHAAVHGDSTVTAGDLPEPGLRLGDYVLEEQIGRGGMGVVYRAKQSSLNRLVAIKLLPNSHLLSPTQLRRFNLESHAAAQLRHSNIVPVFAVGQEKNVHYFAMQLIAGCSLEKVDYRTWSTSGCRPLIASAIELADALAHAHESGIIHRDIKPSNLLLDEQSKVWITDFGLAMCQGDARLTMSGDLIGTMNYMSPEQSRGEPVDERTDVYSFGVTLYELVTGRAAFAGQVRGEVFRAIENDEPTPPRKLNAQCPYDLETIILKAMSKDRAERYASAAAMRDDLRRVLSGQPIYGRRPAVWQRGWRWAQRHRSLVTVAAVGMAATCLSITLGAAQVLFTQSQLAATRIESSNNLALADENYWQGRNLVQRWNKEVVQKLADIPGAEALQANMLSDTIEYYQSFLEKAQSQVVDSTSHQTADPALAKDIAAARLSLAAAFDANGQTGPAIETYQQGIEELASIRSRDHSVNSRLAIAQNDLAVVLLRDGRPKDARQLLDDAQSLLEQTSPRQEDVQAAIGANLARAYEALGDTPSQIAALVQSEKIYRQAIEETKTEVERGALHSELGAVLDFRALCLAKSDQALATQLSQEAVACHQASCRAEGAPLDWLRRLAASQHNLAVLLLEQGQYAAARSSFAEAIATKLMIGQRSGLKQGTGADAAISYLAWGRMESRLSQSAAAQDCFKQAEAAVRHDLAIQKSPENQILLGESLASHFRLTKNEQLRLELSRLLRGLSELELTDAQKKNVSELGKLVIPLSKEVIEPVSPGQVSPVESNARPGDRLSETEL